jgi:hypothetical protein
LKRFPIRKYVFAIVFHGGKIIEKVSTQETSFLHVLAGTINFKKCFPRGK